MDNLTQQQPNHAANKHPGCLPEADGEQLIKKSQGRSLLERSKHKKLLLSMRHCSYHKESGSTHVAGNIHKGLNVIGGNTLMDNSTHNWPWNG